MKVTSRRETKGSPRDVLIGLRLSLKSVVRAFSSEVDTGSREENASKQKARA
jgi:hypothetical protein